MEFTCIWYKGSFGQHKGKLMYKECCERVKLCKHYSQVLLWVAINMGAALLYLWFELSL